MIRKILLVVVILSVAVAAVYFWLTRPLPILTVTTWPGAYGRAQAHAMTQPYGSAKHVDVRIAQWEGELKDVADAVARHNYKGDVIDFELPKAVEACRRGLLEKIDTTTLPPGRDGTPAAADFVPGALGPCWVGSVVYSQAIIFAPSVAGEPKTLNDFFDSAKFPGARALNRSSAKFNLEMALLADGVAPKDVYTVLSTPDGVARALHKLDSLKPNLVWWSAAGEPARLVKSGAATFATILNGEGGIFDARSNAPGIIWDRQLYELDVFGIPAGDPKKDMALDFIRYATGSVPLAGVASWVPYGPARRSSRALVGNNPDLHIAMTPWLPTTHFDSAFAVDDAWWLAHGAEIAPRWQAWLDQH